MTRIIPCTSLGVCFRSSRCSIAFLQVYASSSTDRTKEVLLNWPYRCFFLSQHYAGYAPTGDHSLEEVVLFPVLPTGFVVHVEL